MIFFFKITLKTNGNFLKREIEIDNLYKIKKIIQIHFSLFGSLRFKSDHTMSYSMILYYSKFTIYCEIKHLQKALIISNLSQILRLKIG